MFYLYAGKPISLYTVYPQVYACSLVVRKPTFAKSVFDVFAEKSMFDLYAKKPLSALYTKLPMFDLYAGKPTLLPKLSTPSD